MKTVKPFDAHYLTEGVMGGKALAVAQCVLASDYAALEAERDELRAQVEAMRAQVDGLKDVLAGAYAWMEDATSKVLYPIALHETGRVAMEAEGLGSCTPDLFKSIDAALQAKP